MTYRLINTLVLFALLPLLAPLALAADEKPPAPSVPVNSTIDPLATIRTSIALAQRDFFVAAKDESDAQYEALSACEKCATAKAKKDRLTKEIVGQYQSAQKLCQDAKLGQFNPETLICSPAPTSSAIANPGTPIGPAPTGPISTPPPLPTVPKAPAKAK